LLCASCPPGTWVDPAPLPSGAPFPAAYAATAAIDIRRPLSDIPPLSSLPGARASLYLDFDGFELLRYGQYANIVVPPFDQDGDPSSFNSAELTAIERIWSYVAEDFAPFQLNVTTVTPSSLAHGTTLRVVIGGDGRWTGAKYGGISYVNNFTNTDIPNVAFVFSENLARGNVRYTADAISHEAGHSFGLEHQSTYQGNRKIEEYSTGPRDGTAPLMGKSYDAVRSLWWQGTSSVGPGVWQDDMSILAGPRNGFGYRPDLEGDSAATATPLRIEPDGRLSGSGLIHVTSDLDFFSFTSGAGTISLVISPPPLVGNLAPRVELLDASGTSVLATAGPSADFSARVSVTLPVAGSYLLKVASGGGSGNVGQYEISGWVVPMAEASVPSPRVPAERPPAPPVGVRAEGVAAQIIRLSWNPLTSEAVALRVERSEDGIRWTMIAELPPSSSVLEDPSVAPATTYSYRVTVVATGGVSHPSEPAWATTLPLAPPFAVASPVGSDRVVVSWGEVAGAAGYRIERSTDGVAWMLLGVASPLSFSITDLWVVPGGAYWYRVRAFNAAGASEPSTTSRVSLTLSPRPPGAVSELTARRDPQGRVLLNWQAPEGEVSGYRIERSLNGRTWTNLTTLEADHTSFEDRSAFSGRRYVYRVWSFNPWGISAVGRTVLVSTPPSRPRIGRFPPRIA
jgi:hypothetical protein